jgi:phthalate 4,5-cis-dihydrodiol dehydrogenase
MSSLQRGYMRPLRLGIAGLGRAFSLMEPTLRADQRINIKAGADPRPEARNVFERTYDAKSYAHVDDMCGDPDLDVIYIASPHQFHRSHAESAMRQGKHVLVEKPMALSPDDCAAMIEMAEKTKRIMIIGHSHSFDLPIKTCAELIKAQTYGALHMINACQYTDFLYRPRRAEELNTDKGGGVIFNQAPHQIDNVRLLGGGMVESVRAYTGRWDPSRPTEGAYSALLRFKNGAFASLTYSGYAHFDSDEFNGWITESGELKNPDIYGVARAKLKNLHSSDDETALKANQNYGGPLYIPPHGQSEPTSRWHQHFGPLIISCTHADLRPMPNHIIIYADEAREIIPLPRPAIPRSEVIDELYSAIYHEVPPLHDGAWALATMEVCYAILQSARTDKDIKMTKQKAI